MLATVVSDGNVKKLEASARLAFIVIVINKQRLRFVCAVVVKSAQSGTEQGMIQLLHRMAFKSRVQVVTDFEQTSRIWLG